jgi:TPR repeat protein
MRRITAAAVMILFALPAWADFQDGLDAANRGDFETALREWQPLADQGDVSAQHNLSDMYYNGWGVPQDYAEAMKWARLAADQGNANAQSNLGFMYYNGQGVLQDYVLAHMCWNLASAQGGEDARENRNIVAGQMPPSEIKEVQRLAREWLAAHPK